MQNDLPELLEVVGLALLKAETALILLIDELQYVEEKQLAALITSLHRCAQKKLPVTMIGAGLPQLRGQLGDAKSYAERLFEFHEIGQLTKQDSFDAAAAIPKNNAKITMGKISFSAITRTILSGTTCAIKFLASCEPGLSQM